jgi:hypothetical protein
MIMGTAMIMTITVTIITIMISAGPSLVRCRRPHLGALPLPIWGEGWGEGITGEAERAKPLTPTLSLWEREQTEPVAHESLR